MDATQKPVQLSRSQFEYLKHARFLPAALAQLLSTALVERDDACVLSVSRDVAEEFRSAFTHRLAASGFGADYEPNSEGRMLEELIDRFHFGERRV
jgi:hypothetical protein